MPKTLNKKLHAQILKTISLALDDADKIVHILEKTAPGDKVKLNKVKTSALSVVSLMQTAIDELDLDEHDLGRCSECNSKLMPHEECANDPGCCSGLVECRKCNRIQPKK